VDKSLRLYDEKLQSVSVSNASGRTQSPVERTRDPKPESAPVPVVAPETGEEIKHSGRRKRG
jgi:hypothetical protein